MIKMKYSKYYIKKKNNMLSESDKKFIKWMDEIEKIVFNELQCDLLDLPDENYMESFEIGVKSIDMANSITNNYTYLL